MPCKVINSISYVMFSQKTQNEDDIKGTHGQTFYVFQMSSSTKTKTKGMVARKYKNLKQWHGEWKSWFCVLLHDIYMTIILVWKIHLVYSRPRQPYWIQGGYISWNLILTKLHRHFKAYKCTLNLEFAKNLANIKDFKANNPGKFLSLWPLIRF